MQYKYSVSDVSEFIALLKSTMYKCLPLRDFSGKALVYLDNITRVNLSSVKLLLSPQINENSFSVKAMEDEIHSTLTIENIASSRDSIRRILGGYAPLNETVSMVLSVAWNSSLTWTIKSQRQIFINYTRPRWGNISTKTTNYCQRTPIGMMMFS